MKDSLADENHKMMIKIPNRDSTDFMNTAVLLIGHEAKYSDYDDFCPGWEAGSDCSYTSEIMFRANREQFSYSHPVLIATSTSVVSRPSNIEGDPSLLDPCPQDYQNRAQA